MALKLKFPSRRKARNKQAEDLAPIKTKPSVAEQFRDADWRNPDTLPTAPKWLLFALIAAGVFLLIGFFVVRDQMDELEARKQDETKLKAEYVEKVTKVANLEPLIEQRKQAEEYVIQLEKQLPGKSEMDALLSDINQAGVGRNLQFELFKPGAEQVKEYYAVLPVAVRVSGAFSDIAAFAADVAKLSRIVTLRNIRISGGRSGESSLVMVGTANTYRYLDAQEKAALKKSDKKK